MRSASTAQRRLGSTGLLLILLLSAACRTWQLQTASPEAVVSLQPHHVKLTRRDGSVQHMYAPRFHGDSIRGAASAGAYAPRFAVAVSDIRQVAVQRISAGRTIALVAGAGVTAALIAALISDPPAAARPPASGGGAGGYEYYSCPLVYSWSAGEWRLDSGTFGGAISAGLARTDVDNLLFASPVGGVLRFKVANEMDEIDHVDALTVVAVDHAPGTTVAPGPDGTIHSLQVPSRPLSARDYRGHDALARVSTADGWSWESIPTGRDSIRTEDIRDGLELEFVRPANTAAARLVIDANVTPWATYLMARYVEAHGSATRAWYDSLDTRPAYASAMGRALASEAFLSVLVLTDTGWTRQAVTSDAGPEISKRQVVELDVGRVTGPTVRVRLESAPSFWLVDAVALDASVEQPVRLQDMLPISAIAAGRDVRAILTAIDRSELVLERGDSAIVTFAAPPETPGYARSYLLRSHGWYRLNLSDDSPPDLALLRTARTPRGMSRLATERLANAVAASDERAQ